MWCLLPFLCFIVRVQSEEESTCRAGAACGEEEPSPYFWPTAFGHVSHYGVAPWPSPTNLSATLSWSWHHPDGRFRELPIGVVIDDKKNLYVSADQHSYKLSPDGAVLWTHKNPPGGTPDGPSIMDGSFFADSAEGFVFALDMETGVQKWISKVDDRICGDTGFVSAHQGVVVVATGSRRVAIGEDGCGVVRGLNASDGSALWALEPENGLWDFMAQFPDDGSVVFQDCSGVIHRAGLTDGSLIWKGGGVPGSWTDGTQFLGPNGIVYQTNNNPGTLGAYRLSDGKLLWKQSVPKSPNTSPVVGRLRKDGHLSVVMPIGHQTPYGGMPPAVLVFQYLPFLQRAPDLLKAAIFLPLHYFSIWLGDYQHHLWRNEPRLHEVWVFDAETGDLQWRWEGPVQYRMNANGDEEAFLDRSSRGVRTVCWPTPWSAARIGSDGTIYIGNENGHFFAIRDSNGDNRIDAGEVSSFDTGTNFPSCGSAHAPGMIAAANCDSVYVWKS